MFKKASALLVMIFSGSVWATMYLPTSIDRQIEEATSGAEVSLSSSRVYKNGQGAIATEYRFDVLEAYNLKSEDLQNGQLLITLPVGSYQGVTSSIEGAPNFKEHQRIFLLLKKSQGKMYLSNFSMGMYQLEQKENQTHYVSVVFPKTSPDAVIEKTHMIELMNEKWKFSHKETAPSKLKVTELSQKKTLPAFKPRPSEGRLPAQEQDYERVPFSFWLSTFLLIAFFSMFFFKLNQHKSES